MKSRFLFAIIISLGLMACANSKKCEEKKNPHNPQLLNGTWDIEKVACCGRMKKEKIGGTKVLTLNAKNYTYTIEEEGKVVAEGKYKIDEKSDFGAVIHLGDNPYPAMYSVIGKQLILSWQYMDLQEEFYQKR